MCAIASDPGEEFFDAANLARSHGRLARAEALYRNPSPSKEALAMLEATVGIRHEQTAYTRANLADFLWRTGDMPRHCRLQGRQRKTCARRCRKVIAMGNGRAKF
jgi:hypothetical protein